jgi:hypothetical protein
MLRRKMKQGKGVQDGGEIPILAGDFSKDLLGGDI